MMNRRGRILVVGAGVGGLTAALTLHAAGFEVELHEQATSLGEVGAGLTLSRGAQQVFRAIGVQGHVARFATPATAFPFLHFRTAAVLSGQLDLGQGLPDDGSADVPRQCHRADLHAVLAAAFYERVPHGLKLGHQLIGIEETDHRVRIVFANGASAEGDAVIAADGVRSVARALMWGDGSPRFTGQVAYRFLVDKSRAAPHVRLGRGAVFLGPQRTFNRYTLRSGEVFNCVAIVATDSWVQDGWSTPASCDELLREFTGWHAEITALIGAAKSLVKWGLFDRVPLPLWSRGRATLLGDAAHAMLPFLGMGAAMAIEDAMVLARAFAAETSVESALARYERVRRPRTEFIHAKSIEQGRLTQSLHPDEYQPGTAPAEDPSILAYDPVTAAM